MPIAKLQRKTLVHLMYFSSLSVGFAPSVYLTFEERIFFISEIDALFLQCWIYLVLEWIKLTFCTIHYLGRTCGSSWEWIIHCMCCEFGCSGDVYHLHWGKTDFLYSHQDIHIHNFIYLYSVKWVNHKHFQSSMWSRPSIWDWIYSPFFMQGFWWDQGCFILHRGDIAQVAL